jgi:hypothetical protein
MRAMYLINPAPDIPTVAALAEPHLSVLLCDETFREESRRRTDRIVTKRTPRAGASGNESASALNERLQQERRYFALERIITEN